MVMTVGCRHLAAARARGDDTPTWVVTVLLASVTVSVRAASFRNLVWAPARRQGRCECSYCVWGYKT